MFLRIGWRRALLCSGRVRTGPFVPIMEFDLFMSACAVIMEKRVALRLR